MNLLSNRLCPGASTHLPMHTYVYIEAPHCTSPSPLALRITLYITHYSTQRNHYCRPTKAHRLFTEITRPLNIWWAAAVSFPPVPTRGGHLLGRG